MKTSLFKEIKYDLKGQYMSFKENLKFKYLLILRYTFIQCLILSKLLI